MSENREKKEKMTAEARAAAAERLEEALGALPPRYFDAVFGAEAAAEEKKSAKKARKRTAPAWLRPVAACLAVLILGGLVVFSIPVVNNIITNRGTGALPADTPAAEQTAAFENTDAPKETVAPVETEKPEETVAPVETEKPEEEEVCITDKKFAIYLFTIDGKKQACFNQLNPPGKMKTASFNDVYNDEHRLYVASTADAEKLEVGMPISQAVEILGAVNIGGHHTSGGLWALDDGRILCIKVQWYSLKDKWRAMGVWDEEANDFIEPIRNDDPKAIEDFQRKDDEFEWSRPIVEISFLEDDSYWETIVKNSIKYQVIYYYSQDLVPSWDKE